MKFDIIHIQLYNKKNVLQQKKIESGALNREKLLVRIIENNKMLFNVRLDEVKVSFALQGLERYWDRAPLD